MNLPELQSIVAEVNSGKAVLLDVRREDEWQAGHAIPATHFDSAQLLVNGQLPDLDKNTKIYTYCVTGSRAGMMKIVLENYDFKNVENLGSFKNWLAGGGDWGS